MKSPNLSNKQASTDFTELGGVPRAPEGKKSAAPRRAGGSSKQLVIDVNLPAGSYQIKDLPHSVMPWAFASLGEASTQPIKRSPVGVSLPSPTTVHVAIAAVPEGGASMAGVRAGLVTRMARAVVSLVVAVWVALLTLLRLRPRAEAGAAAATAPKSHELALSLKITPSHPLKGTLNGLPAWVAHQEIAGLSYNARGEGTLQGKVRLFNLISLPGLTSRIYPSAMRLVLPKLNVTVSQLAAQGLAQTSQASEGVQVSQDKSGSLVFASKSGSNVVTGFESSRVRVGLQKMNFVADSQSVATHGTALATFGDPTQFKNQLRARWRAQLLADLQNGTLSDSSPAVLTGSVQLDHANFGESQFTPVDGLKVVVRASKQDVYASVHVGSDPQWAGQSQSGGAADAERLNALDGLLGRPQAALLMSLSNVQAHAGTHSDQVFAGLRRESAAYTRDWETDSDVDSDLDVWFDTSEGSMDTESGSPQMPGTPLSFGTPSLTLDSGTELSSAPVTPSLVTPEQAEVLGVAWKQELVDRFSQA